MYRMCVASLTVDALEVQEVGPVVHLVQLQAHFHQVSCHGVLLAHSQVVRVHHLQQKDSVCSCGFVCLLCSTSCYLPVEVELPHGSVHLRHDVVGSALAPDPQVPLGLLHGQGFGPGGVESVQRTAGLRAVGQEGGHSLRVGFDPGGKRHAFLYEGALRRTGSQVELAGLGHDAPVVQYKVVGNSELVLGGQKDRE